MRAVVGLGLLQSLAVQDQLLPLLGMELQPGTADTKSNQNTRNKDTSINMLSLSQIPDCVPLDLSNYAMAGYQWLRLFAKWLLKVGEGFSESSLEAPPAEVSAAELVGSLQLVLINVVGVSQEGAQWIALQQRLGC